MQKTKKIIHALFAVILIGYSIFVSLIAFGGNNKIEQTDNTENAGGMFIRPHEAVDVKRTLEGNDIVIVSQQNNMYFFDGPGTDQAIIFYPGANVEYTAYSILMSKLAENGIDGFLVKMPLDYAFNAIGTAGDIIEDHPEYTHWNLAGHSLGGAMIATYASLSDYQFDGIYLLAAYATFDISNAGEVLVIYGSEDGILNLSKVENGRKFCPNNYREYVINGGNHAQFGSYGIQDGDGTATITTEEQINITVNQIMLNKTSTS